MPDGTWARCGGSADAGGGAGGVNVGLGGAIGTDDGGVNVGTGGAIGDDTDDDDRP